MQKMASLSRWQKDCCVDRSQTSYRTPHSTQLEQIRWFEVSSWYSSPTGLSARSLGGLSPMHCPAYLHIWMQLKNPPSLLLQLLLSLSVGPVNHGNNKGKSIDSVATLSTVLVEPTYLQQISNATFAGCWYEEVCWIGSKFEPQLLDCPLWWCPTGGPVPWFLWADSFAKFWWFSDIGTWRISWV